MYLLALVEEHFDNQVPSFSVIEKDEERPVDEPCSLLQGLQWRIEGVGVNVFLQAIQIFQSCVPVLHQNFRSEFTPQAIQVVLLNKYTIIMLH